uniref:Uncharacterized protein n=1 Tax=viral metagenome TaxID=1070528 RepID=A0A6M3KTZ9_9ZZZZ
MSNAKEKRLKAVEALGKPPKPVSRQEKQEAERVLTEGEKTQLAVMFEKVNNLDNQIAQAQAAVKQVRQGLGEMITGMVAKRGLDVTKWGVNLAQGMILPLEQNGKKPQLREVPRDEEDES